MELSGPQTCTPRPGGSGNRRQPGTGGPARGLTARHTHRLWAGSAPSSLGPGSGGPTVTHSSARPTDGGGSHTAPGPRPCWATSGLALTHAWRATPRTHRAAGGGAAPHRDVGPPPALITWRPLSLLALGTKTGNWACEAYGHRRDRPGPPKARTQRGHSLLHPPAFWEQEALKFKPRSPYLYK